MAIHKIYPSFVKYMMNGNVSDLADISTEIKCALMYQDGDLIPFEFSISDSTWEDILSFECSDIDYPGALEIINKTVSIDANKIIFSSTTTPKRTTYTLNGNITATHAVVFLDSGVNSTSYLIACIEFDKEQTSISGEFSLSWNADGIFRFSV